MKKIILEKIFNILKTIKNILFFLLEEIVFISSVGVSFFLFFILLQDMFNKDIYYETIKIHLIFITIIAALSGLSYRASSSTNNDDDKNFHNINGDRFFHATILELNAIILIYFFYGDYFLIIPNFIRLIFLAIGYLFIFSAFINVAINLFKLQLFFFKRKLLP